MATRMRIEDQPGPSPVVPGVFVVGGILILASIIGAPVFYWGFCQINVPTGYMAVMTRKTGKDIPLSRSSFKTSRPSRLGRKSCAPMIGITGTRRCAAAR